MIALQLYTLRDAFKNNFDESLDRIAAMGFSAVETAGEYGSSPEYAAKRFAEMGIRICASHLPILRDQETSLDTASALGVETVVCPWMAPENFRTLDGILSICDQLNAANEALQARGMRLAYHNHHFELEVLPDGRLPLVVMAETLDDSIVFEVDTYWVQTAGVEALDILRQLGDRAPLLHIKDGPLNLQDAMVAVGDGSMNFPPMLEAHPAEWWIIEMDRCDTDPFVAVEKSLKYLQHLS